MTEQLTSAESKPLVIGLPGFGDRSDYDSYQSWISHLPEVGADSEVLDIYGLTDATRPMVKDRHGSVYFSNIRPHHYFDAIRTVIDSYDPTETVLCGFGFGGREAIQNAFALSQRGYRIAGAVAVAPTIFFDQVEPYSGDWARNPPRSSDPVELHDTTLRRNRQDFSQHWLTCIRHRSIQDPRRRDSITLQVGTQAAVEYADPFQRSLFGTSGGGSGGWRLAGLNELLESRAYELPTLFVGGTYDEKINPKIVRDLANATRYAPAEFIELPICHDFRASQKGIDTVTGTLLDRIGQLLTTRTVQNRRSYRELLSMSVPVTREVRREVIVLSGARSLSSYGRSVIEAAAETGVQLAALCSHDARPRDFVDAMEARGATGLVVDVPKQWWPPMTDGFATRQHPAVADRSGNLSGKRLFGPTLPGDRIFSDDDIKWTAGHVGRAFGALGEYEIAGFLPIFADLSVLEHADALAGGEPEPSISGNSLAVADETGRSFYNDPAYNEDFNGYYPKIEQGKAVLLGTIEQKEYDPFDSPERAVQQVFGEVITEGLYFLLGAGTSYREVGEDFWGFMKGYYGRQIEDTAKRLMAKPGEGDEQVSRALTSMRAMQARLETYTPHDFYTYIQDWHDDRTGRWPEQYDKLPQGMTLAERAAYHGLSAYVVGSSRRHI